MCLECGDDFFGVAHVLGGRSEGGVDDRDLRRVDRELAGEAFAPRRFGFALQAVLIAEFGEHAVDRLNARGDRAGEAERARELVGEAELAAFVIFRRRAERRRQVLGAPAHRRQRRLGIAVGEQVEQARGGLGDDRVNGDASGAVRELDDVGAALRLGQHDAVDIGEADQLEIVLVMLASDRVDAHPPFGAAGARRQMLEHVAGHRFERQARRCPRGRR